MPEAGCPLATACRLALFPPWEGAPLAAAVAVEADAEGTGPGLGDAELEVAGDGADGGLVNSGTGARERKSG